MENAPEGSGAPPIGPGVVAGGTALSRNPFGWLLLALLFALVIRGALTQSYGRESSGDPQIKIVERTIESTLSISAASGLKGTAAGGPEKGLSDARASLNSNSPEAAFLRIVIDRELRRKPDPRDVQTARAAPKEIAPAVALATAEKPGKVAPARKDDRFTVRLATAQARERSGVPRVQAREGLVRPDYAIRLGLFGLGVVGAAAAGVALLGWYAISRANGSLLPQGLPSLPMTPAEGDRFGLRAALMFGGFLLGSTAVSLMKLPSQFALLAQAVLLGAMALYALRLPRDARAPHLSAAGLQMNLERLGERVAWGVSAALANVPILLLLTVVSNVVLKHAPPPTHPSTEVLLRNPAVGTVLLTFFLASICAPLWEEVMFRGLLFQGLAGARMAPVLAALLSSFLFAAIHPQGLAAWPALAGVALMSCALLAQTRSLVPSIVMHATHNSLLLIGTLIAGPVLG